MSFQGRQSPEEQGRQKQQERLDLNIRLSLKCSFAFSFCYGSPCNPRLFMATDRGSGGPRPRGHIIETSLLIDFSLLNTKARLARERSGSKGMSTPDVA